MTVFCVGFKSSLTQILTTIAAVLPVGCASTQLPESPTVKAPDISIHKAADDGNIEAIKQHIAAGTDVNIKDDDGFTALYFAAQEGQKEIAELLIEKGADVNVKLESQTAKENGMGGATPLRGAVANGHKETAELLIVKGADVNVKEDLGLTLLHFANTREIAELLIAKGLDVNAKCNDDGTPLHDAAAEGYKEVAELFIAKGADVNAMSNKGKSPLDWAIEEGHTETADLLRKNGAKAATVKPAAEANGYFGTYTLSIDGGTITIELKPDGSFIGTPSGSEEDRAFGSWKVEGELLICEGKTEKSSDKIGIKFNKTSGKLNTISERGKEMPIDNKIPEGADGIYVKKPPKVEELLNSIGTPLNEMEKIISDEKYLEKLVGDSSAPRETINRANHTYSILYIDGEDRTLVHGVWMIKDNTFYYMEVVDGGIQIPEEEREVLSANIISLKKDKSQMSNPPLDGSEQSRFIWTAIDEFKEKEMKSFNNEQLNENFNIFEKSR